MRKILIFGNSGSGKTTLAKALCSAHGLAHLDLDTLAWEPAEPPQRKPLEDSGRDMAGFIAANSGWVIEGCYTDLLELAAPHASEIIYMNLPVTACIANARARPWEPHKYASRAAQDANLDMLINWISQYDKRADTFSARAHEAFYRACSGKKSRITGNRQLP